MQGLPLFFVASIVGGLAWAVVGGASGNYLLEKIPEGKRPSYLAWYNLSLNTAVLLGSLIGPLLAEQIGLVAALFWSALGRVIAAILIWRKG
jgi:MFS family permease